jgi:hypothetical protein
MIPVEKLESIKTVITHDACPDGLASAMIIKCVLPEVEVRFLSHDSIEHKSLEATPGMIFCDFSPIRERAKEFIDAGSIVLDHHKHQKDLVVSFGDNGVFADEIEHPGVSGALLAYQEVVLPIIRVNYFKISKAKLILIKNFATLVGIRDTWQKNSSRWNEAKELSESLMFFSREEWLKNPIFDTKEWWNRIKTGKYLVENQNQKVRKILKDAYRTNICKLNILIHQGVKSTSDVSEVVDNVDLIFGFKYYFDKEGPNFQVSCRSKCEFDIGAFAKFYGGGGHTKASGFTEKIRYGTVNVYSHMLDLIIYYFYCTKSCEITTFEDLNEWCESMGINGNKMVPQRTFDVLRNSLGIPYTVLPIATKREFYTEENEQPTR